MNFKTQQLADIQSVFFNLDEFGESCSLRGVVLDCVVNSDVNDDAVKSTGAVGFNAGLFDYNLEIFYRSSDFPYRFVEGENVYFESAAITLNNFYVVKCVENMGVVQLQLTDKMS